MARKLMLLIPAALIVWAGGCLKTLDGPTCTPQTVTQTAVIGDTIVLSSGLRYISAPQGEGAAANWCHVVLIHYDAYLTDGTKWDSSREGTGLLFQPGVGDVIEGLEQGVIGLRPGSIRRLIIPPALAYGSDERVDPVTHQVIVPANSTVVFDIEVIVSQ